jgi:hypothetical protein
MHRSRFSGTFPNPYDFGYVLLLPLFISLIYVMFKSKINTRIFALIILIAALIMLFGTQSRTSFIGLSFGVLYVLILLFFLLAKYRTHKFLNINMKLMFYFLIVVISCIIGYDILKYNYSYLFTGLESFLLSGRTGSTDARLIELYHVKNSFTGLFDILIGNGVSKGEIKNLESSYLLYPFRYGLYGLFLLILIFGSSILYSFNNIIKFKDTDPLFYSFIIGVHVWFIVTPIVSLTNCYIDMPRVQFIFFFIFGLSVLLNKNYNSIHFSKYTM